MVVSCMQEEIKYLSKSIALCLRKCNVELLLCMQFKWVKTEKNYIIFRCFYGMSEGQLYNQRICLPEIVLASLAVSWVHWWGPVGDTSLRAAWASGIKGSVSIEEEIKLEPSIYIFWLFWPIYYVSINTVLSVSKIERFLDPPTRSFCWRNIWVVP